MKNKTIAIFLIYEPFFFRYWMDLTRSDVFWQLSDTGWAKAAWFAGPWIMGSCMFITEAPFTAKHTIEVSYSISLIFK